MNLHDFTLWLIFGVFIFAILAVIFLIIFESYCDRRERKLDLCSGKELPKESESLKFFKFCAKKHPNIVFEFLFTKEMK